MANIAINLAKTARPVSKGLLRRSRLLARLDEVRHKSALIWVSSPAGSGKIFFIRGERHRRQQLA